MRNSNRTRTTITTVTSVTTARILLTIPPTSPALLSTNGIKNKVNSAADKEGEGKRNWGRGKRKDEGGRKGEGGKVISRK